MSTSVSFRKRSPGFTLIELVMVMLVAGLTLGLVFTSVERGSRKMKERELVHSFVQELRRARLTAGRTGRLQRFRIKGGQNPEFGSDAGSMTGIPSGVDIFASRLGMDEESQELVVEFQPDGSVNEREFQIKFGEERDYRIHLHPLFGTVRWEKLGSTQ